MILYNVENDKKQLLTTKLNILLLIKESLNKEIAFKKNYFEKNC